MLFGKTQRGAALTVVFAGMFATACVHPADVREEAAANRTLAYAPASESQTTPRGYFVRETEQGLAVVMVRGSGVDRHARLRDIALRSAADHGLENGYDKFQITGLEEGMMCDLANKVSDPTVVMTVDYRLLSLDPDVGQIYDAAQVSAAYKNVIETPRSGIWQREWEVSANRVYCLELLEAAMETPEQSE